MKFKEFKHEPVEPDTYEASMALNQLMRIGKHAIKLHNMIDDRAEMESWVAKKIDLAGDYVKKVYNYTEGEKAGLYDDGGMTEDAGDQDEKIVDMLRNIKQHLDNHPNMSEHPSLVALDQLADDLESGDKPADYESVSEDAGEGHMSKSTLYHTAKYAIELMQMIRKGDDLEGWVQSKLNKAADYLQGVYNYEEYQKLNPYREDLDSKVLQKHAQVVQKNIDEILSKETSLDDIDTKPGMMRILAKRVNEVEKEIAKETRKQNEGKMSDIDADMKTMSDDDFMKKYKKSKEQMKKDLNEDGHMDIPSAIRNCETIMEDAMQIKQKLQTMEGELPSWMTQMIAVAASDLNDARDYLVNPTTESGIMYRAGVKKYGKKGMTAIQSAAGKGASHQEIGKIKDKYLKDEELDEGLKDWAKGLAAAGVIVGAVAGMGSINNAIDNSVPAVKALNNAYELAMDQGHTELATNIKQDLSAVKVRLQSGKDLDFVKSMQDKYSKFVDAGGLPYDIDTESKAYESKLAFMLNQQLK